MGTLATALARKKIRSDKNRYTAVITGDIENVEGVLKITRINVIYSLKLPKEKSEEALEALDLYLKSCPAAQSVIGCIDITHKLELEETE